MQAQHGCTATAPIPIITMTPKTDHSPHKFHSDTEMIEHRLGGIDNAKHDHNRLNIYIYIYN